MNAGRTFWPEPSAVLASGLEAALFDLDNTLIQTRIDFAQMRRDIVALIASYGVSEATARDQDILATVNAARSILRRSHRFHEAERLRADAFRALREIEIRDCADAAAAPGARETLGSMRSRGVLTAIVTRNCRSVSEDLLARGGLVCDALVTREDVAHTKPHPGHLRLALRTLSARRGSRLRTQNCVMVGDHWMDVMAGRAMNMRTVGLSGLRAESHFAPARPDVLLPSCAELWALEQAAAAKDDARESCAP